MDNPIWRRERMAKCIKNIVNLVLVDQYNLELKSKLTKSIIIITPVTLLKQIRVSTIMKRLEKNLKNAKSKSIRSPDATRKVHYQNPWQLSGHSCRNDGLGCLPHQEPTSNLICGPSIEHWILAVMFKKRVKIQVCVINAFWRLRSDKMYELW